ncbi:CMP-sialic acid transporter 2 [Capsicum annuum]|nr:CMP-sialic acid transporter 2 [Capsicum annuum]
MKNGMAECAVCHSRLVSPTVKTISRAYDRHRSKISSKQRALNVLLVVGDCMLVGLQPVLVFMSKVDGKFKFSPVSVNFLTEATKVVFAIIMLLIQARHQKVGEKPLLSISTFVQAARNNVLLAVPALLYAINNYLKFIMQLASYQTIHSGSLLPLLLFLTFSLKYFCTVIFQPSNSEDAEQSEGKYGRRLRSVHEFYRSFANVAGFGYCYAVETYHETAIFRNTGLIVLQWEALALLLIGISINQLRSLPEGATSLALPVTTIAYIYTLVFVTVPSMASVFNEYALKSQYDTSIYLQNLFLYGYGAIFNFLAILGIAVFKGPGSLDIFQGHSKATMLLIVNNAAQGILSSFFFKYADTILKKYSSTVATIFTGIASALLFGHRLTANFLLGISVVFISMHQFFSPLAKVKDDQQNGSLELIDARENHRSKDSSFVNIAAGANEEASHRVGPDERQPLLPR